MHKRQRRCTHFNPPAPCGAGRFGRRPGRRPVHFNPPAPCGAGRSATMSAKSERHFNPPAPCGAGRNVRMDNNSRWDFNPPAPCGAGRRRYRDLFCERNFNPPAPCGAGRLVHDYEHILLMISIHPPLAGRDIACAQATSPCVISIHPPLAGRDFMWRWSRHDLFYFNPPAPCGAGPVRSKYTQEGDEFQSTRPLRGGTSLPSLHTTVSLFQSTRPLRGGTLKSVISRFSRKFQSTRPLRGGTLEYSCASMVVGYFNPPAPCGAGQRSCTKKLCKTSHIAQKVHLPWPY